MKRVLSLILMILSGILISGHAQNKRALIICVGEQEDSSWTDTHAENDLWYVTELLNFYKYDNICSITGKQATKHGILKMFDTFTTECNKGDNVYIHFSGHGQRMTDLNGDECDVLERDFYDESWIPYDAYLTCCDQDNGDKHLSDDEIAVILSRIKKKIGNEGQILVVVDACHSGGSTRGEKKSADGQCLRGTEKYFTLSDNQGSHSVEISEEWLTLSACQDWQTNAECISPQVGKLTYILYKLRKSLRSMSNDELIETISKMMNSGPLKSRDRQDPDLSQYPCSINTFFQR